MMRSRGYKSIKAWQLADDLAVAVREGRWRSSVTMFILQNASAILIEKFQASWKRIVMKQRESSMAS